MHFPTSSTMSVVREILGVAQVSGPPTAAVMSLITKPPPVPKKRKSFLKEAREVANLRDSDGLVTSPPMSPEDSGSRTWKWKKFRNSIALSGDQILLSHWDHREDEGNRDYSAVRCYISVELPDPTSVPETVVSDVTKKYNLTQTHFTNIFQTLDLTDLNFIVTADRLNLTVDQVKDVYYTVYAAAFPGRKCKYSHEADVERRKILEEKTVSIATEGAEKVNELRRREKELMAEIKELESDMKSLETEFSVVEKIITPEPAVAPVKTIKQKGSLVKLASEEKKPAGYEFINKYVPGVVELNAFLSGKSAEIPKSTVQMVGKQAVDFTALTQVSPNCTSFNSKKIMDFFTTLAELNEQEKQLTGFIRKREAEIKALSKLDS